ncbi:MAG TPA: hypothetical protein VKA18_05195 [Alphaproteobacteria bacterium]|nr:hypothetical protein [Alphaproteobacteria bacterium]
MSGRNTFRSVFKRPKPDGRWSLAHPLREPIRAIGQSMVAWPAAAFAAIMLAAPREGIEQPALVILVLQVTVLYPIIAIAAIGLHFALARIGARGLSPLPLLVPMAIVALWLVTLTLFLAKFSASTLGWL